MTQALKLFVAYCGWCTWKELCV